MKDYHVVSFSGGKDSTAMLMRMIAEEMPIDEIIFCDTGVEFDELYQHIDDVERYIKRPITRLRGKYSFKYLLTDWPQRKNPNKIGWGFPRLRARWCNKELKTAVISDHLKQKRGNYNVLEYVGIACDEPNRVRDKVYPLVDWGMSEADCLAYCKERGFDFGGLYDRFTRLGCWCCPFQGIRGLRILWKYYRAKFDTLSQWEQEMLNNPRMKDPNKGRKYNTLLSSDITLEELRVRFETEEECKTKGLPITGRQFSRYWKSRAGIIKDKQLSLF